MRARIRTPIALQHDDKTGGRSLSATSPPFRQESGFRSDLKRKSKKGPDLHAQRTDDEQSWSHAMALRHT